MFDEVYWYYECECVLIYGSDVDLNVWIFENIFGCFVSVLF